VPAAAVIRRVQTLLGIIGRKAHVGGSDKSDVKSLGLTEDVHPKLWSLSMEEGRRIPGVEVKFVDIGRNTSGEGGDLGQY
jgi:hypothetical protein